MKYSYSMALIDHEGEMQWVAQSKEMKNCYGVGDTQEEALEELAENEAALIEAAIEHNYPLPAIQVEQSERFSGKLTLRISPKEHELAAKQAQRQGISLNQYINDGIVAYSREVFVPAWETVDIHSKVSRLDENLSVTGRKRASYSPAVVDNPYYFAKLNNKDEKTPVA